MNNEGRDNTKSRVGDINDYNLRDAKIIDKYDFSSGGIILNRNAYEQQEGGWLYEYVIIIPVILEEWEFNEITE